MQPHATVTHGPEASCPPPNLRQRQTAWQVRASSSQLPQALCPPCLLGPCPPTSSLCREGTAPPPPGSLPLCGSRPGPRGLWPSPHHIASPWACRGPGAPGPGGASTERFKHANLCPAGRAWPPGCCTPARAHACSVASVVSSSLRPYGLQPSSWRVPSHPRGQAPQPRPLPPGLLTAICEAGPEGELLKPHTLPGHPPLLVPEGWPCWGWAPSAGSPGGHPGGPLYPAPRPSRWPLGGWAGTRNPNQR